MEKSATYLLNTPSYQELRLFISLGVQDEKCLLIYSPLTVNVCLPRIRSPSKLGLLLKGAICSQWEYFCIIFFHNEKKGEHFHARAISFGTDHLIFRVRVGGECGKMSSGLDFVLSTMRARFLFAFLQSVQSHLPWSWP